MLKVRKQVPVQYLVKEPGSNYMINKAGIGIGRKYDFMKTNKNYVTPSPQAYDAHIKDSTSYKS